MDQIPGIIMDEWPVVRPLIRKRVIEIGKFSVIETNRIKQHKKTAQEDT
jgi:hypothetical protein